MSLFQIDQAKEASVTEIREGPFLFRYAYARSRDSRSNNEKGQDYITWRVSSDKLVFALCDGVSKSFYGEVGARILGNVLVGWLWQNKFDDYWFDDEKPRQLERYLNSIIDSAESIIEQVDLNIIDNAYIRDALDSRRLQTGTQSNFVCGVIELPGEKHVFGNIELFWLGDAKIKIFNNVHDLSDQLHAQWNSKEGWSSREGVIGKIQHYQGTFENLDSIIAHSDGLDQIRSILSPTLHSVELDRRIQEQNGTPQSDDISYLEISISLSVSPYPPIPPEPQKKPAFSLAVVLLIFVIALPFLFLLGKNRIPGVTSEDLLETIQLPLNQSLDLSTVVGITQVGNQTPATSEIVVPTVSTTIMPTQLGEVVARQEVRIVSDNYNQSLLTGCNNISSLHRFESDSTQLIINGPFLVKAYTLKNCHGDPLFVIFEWSIDEQTYGDIQSLYVDEIPFQLK